MIRSAIMSWAFGAGAAISLGANPGNGAGAYFGSGTDPHLSLSCAWHYLDRSTTNLHLVVGYRVILTALKTSEHGQLFGSAISRFFVWDGCPLDRQHNSGIVQVTLALCQAIGDNFQISLRHGQPLPRTHRLFVDQSKILG
jgi:hypothetical protein